MAVFGLQIDFMNRLLKDYFGINNPTFNQNEIYIGLGLTQRGSQVNTEDFTEIFDGKPLGNYKRARAIFHKAIDNCILNENQIVFNTASEDWTTGTSLIERIGIFDTLDYEDSDGNLIKPLVVLELPVAEAVLKGETLLLAPGAIQLNLSDI